MPSARSAFGLLVCLWTVGAAMSLQASDLHPLVVALVEARGDTYFEPAGRQIVIRHQPMRLFIRIQNTSENAVEIQVRSDKAYSIELKGEDGLTVMVKRKIGTSGETKDAVQDNPSTGAEDDTKVNLSPGTETIIPVHLSRDAWDGIPDLKAGKQSKYTARVLYETVNGQQIYSEPYTLIFDIAE